MVLMSPGAACDVSNHAVARELKSLLGLARVCT